MYILYESSWQVLTNWFLIKHLLCFIDIPSSCDQIERFNIVYCNMDGWRLAMGLSLEWKYIVFLSAKLRKIEFCLSCCFSDAASVVCRRLLARSPRCTCWVRPPLPRPLAPTTYVQSEALLCPSSAWSAGPSSPQHPATASHNPPSVSLISLYHCPCLPP